jgi:hypothetical protein
MAKRKGANKKNEDHVVEVVVGVEEEAKVLLPIHFDEHSSPVHQPRYVACRMHVFHCFDKLLMLL